MKTFLGIAAALAWLFGVGLLVTPAGFYAPLGVTMTPMIATIAQAHGATLVGLGVVTWLGRNADKQGLIAILGGNLVVQVLSLAVAIRIVTLGAGVSAAPALAIHVVLGSLYATFLTKARRL